MIELTPADLPDALASMDTAPGITEAVAGALYEESCQISQDQERSGILCTHAERYNRLALAAMRAVASRTRPATPAPDALLHDVLLAVKRREAYPGELSYLERQLNEILIRTPVPARSPGS